MPTTNYAKKLQRMEQKETIKKIARFMQGYFGEYFENKKVRVLDIGCGVGHYMKALKKLGIQHVDGIEIDKTCVEACVKDGLSVMQGDILKPTKRIFQKKYDIVIAFDVLEHFPMEKAPLFIKNAQRFVKEGGKLLIRTPSMNNPFSLSIRYIDITHHVGFTEESLTQLMDELQIKKYHIRFLDIFVIGDPNIFRLLCKLFAKILLRVVEFFFKIYYYCFNSKWKNMQLDVLLVIEK